MDFLLAGRNRDMFTKHEASSGLVPHQRSKHFSIHTREATELARRSWGLFLLLQLLVIALLDSYLGHSFLLKCEKKKKEKEKTHTPIHFIMPQYYVFVYIFFLTEEEKNPAFVRNPFNKLFIVVSR